jgi:hypothetical protein
MDLKDERMRPEEREDLLFPFKCLDSFLIVGLAEFENTGRVIA